MLYDGNIIESESTEKNTKELHATDSRFCGFHGGKNTDGSPCGKRAGAGTDHKGTGKCKRCCRFGGGRPPSTYQHIGPKWRNQIAEASQRFLNDDSDPLSLMLDQWAFGCEIVDRLLASYNVDTTSPDFDPQKAPVIDGVSALTLLEALNKTIGMGLKYEQARASRSLSSAETTRHYIELALFIQTLPEQFRPALRRFMAERHGVSVSVSDASDTVNSLPAPS